MFCEILPSLGGFSYLFISLVGKFGSLNKSDFNQKSKATRGHVPAEFQSEFRTASKCRWESPSGTLLCKRAGAFSGRRDNFAESE